MSAPTGPLARRLGTGDAVVVGLCAMVGAGVFVVFAPAAAAAGSGLVIGLCLAAVVATCNAVASAQLAMTYPTSGGTYVYGREVLGEWWGFLAGWGFVVGKTASCAAMAMTFAAYALPDAGWWQRGAAVLAVVALTVANLRGVTRTATVARVLLALTLLTLAVFVALAWRLAAAGSGPEPLDLDGGAYGVLQSAGLLFFAFAGYARIATLAEEVRRPEMLGRAVLSRGDVGRVHLYRWGDGGAHFHVWFMPRPLGMLEASGAMLPLWEDVLPNVSDDELQTAAEAIAAAMT